jgi:hypothetical protein
MYSKCHNRSKQLLLYRKYWYRVIINDLVRSTVGVGDVVKCAASLIT